VGICAVVLHKFSRLPGPLELVLGAPWPFHSFLLISVLVCPKFSVVFACTRLDFPGLEFRSFVLACTRVHLSGLHSFLLTWTCLRGARLHSSWLTCIRFYSPELSCIRLHSSGLTYTRLHSPWLAGHACIHFYSPELACTRLDLPWLVFTCLSFVWDCLHSFFTHLDLPAVFCIHLGLSGLACTRFYPPEFACTRLHSPLHVWTCLDSSGLIYILLCLPGFVLTRLHSLLLTRTYFHSSDANITTDKLIPTSHLCLSSLVVACLCFLVSFHVCPKFLFFFLFFCFFLTNLTLVHGSNRFWTGTGPSEPVRWGSVQGSGDPSEPNFSEVRGSEKKVEEPDWTGLRQTSSRLGVDRRMSFVTWYANIVLSRSHKQDVLK